MDAVPFLKAPLWLLPTLMHAPAENQDPWIERWWHSCVALFLKTLSWSSRRAVLRWWCGGFFVLLVLALRSACLVIYTLGVFCWDPLVFAAVCGSLGRFLVVVGLWRRCLYNGGVSQWMQCSMSCLFG
jgi:hypothetical protein